MASKAQRRYKMDPSGDSATVEGVSGAPGDGTDDAPRAGGGSRLATPADENRWALMDKMGINADDLRTENNKRFQDWVKTKKDPGPGPKTSRYEKAKGAD